MAYPMDSTNIKLGSCKLWYDTGSGYVAAGLTGDDFNVKVTPTYHDIIAGQYGKILVDKRIIGESANVSFTALETTKALLVQAYPLLTVYTGASTSYGIGRSDFASILDFAVKIKVHPINTLGTGATDDETVLTDDITFWVCANIEALDLNYKSDTEAVYKMNFTVFADTTKSSGMLLGIIGDPANTTLDVTAPTVSALKVEKTNVLTAVVKGTNLTGVDLDTTIEVTFSENVDSGGALNYRNYVLVNETTGVQVDLSAATITYSTSTFKALITPAASILTGIVYAIGVSGIKDISGNQMIPDVRLITGA